MSNIKQVIIARKDLNMRKGKLAAQVAHASLAVVLDLMTTTREKKTLPSISHETTLVERRLITTEQMALEQWLSHKFTKVVVGVNSEKELLDIYNEVRTTTDIPCSLIRDAGDTEFHGVPTYTTVAIGPDYSEKIDHITGHLKLL